MDSVFLCLVLIGKGGYGNGGGGGEESGFTVIVCVFYATLVFNIPCDVSWVVGANQTVMGQQ